MNMPAPRHGQICGKLLRLLGRFLDDHDIGHLIANDAGVQTEHDPDTVRGPDVAFYSYDRLPRGPLPEGYLAVVPELVFEVRSPSDRWPGVLRKVAEYLEAGVGVVCVFDPGTASAHVFHGDPPARIIGPDQELTIPEVLGEFRVTVRRFFE